ncbi:MAG: hypothetical protein E6K80_04655 [Candidatus Eisenbacteria bacterium]|uniref:OB domain-containing protein n=1 Tax=Eiseniibacteriota bacterium TaxID=2212470 RepID=A0A538U7A5_UNCEI|nr:MAG: hypothetical protein E6K80_04655 [Candidatus Eisenbacteria bacterium]
MLALVTGPFPARESTGGEHGRMTQSESTSTSGAGASRAVTLEGLGDWRRTHTCGDLTRHEASRPATLMGWVHRMRDHGGVLFVDLRDRYGITQVVFRPETSGAALVARAAEVGHEWVIAVRGPVVMRPADSLNPELPTGEVELEARELKVLAAAAPLPFQVNEAIHLANEDLRLRYRYLDLRRPELAAMLALRARAAQAARTYLAGASFLEIETPMLVKPTPDPSRRSSTSRCSWCRAATVISRSPAACATRTCVPIASPSTRRSISR